jgi:hypothetical protein
MNEDEDEDEDDELLLVLLLLLLLMNGLFIVIFDISGIDGILIGDFIIVFTNRYTLFEFIYGQLLSNTGICPNVITFDITEGNQTLTISDAINACARTTL